MSQAPVIASLTSRAVIAVRGEDWRSFLQGLLTNDVETLAVGEARFAGLLTPQGRLLYDLFVMATEDGALLDVEAQHRDAIIQRLTMYRLRAKVEIVADDRAVSGYFYSDCPREGGNPSDGPEPATPATPPIPLGSPPSRGQSGLGEIWVLDPRLPALGWRGYRVAGTAPETAYDTHRLALGIPGPGDWGTDKTYPIEANFDLLNGIDFKKGCFVGQETTSRMHRRGVVKTRMLPITFEGEPPPLGTEILAGDLRAGEVLSGMGGRAMAMLRLDRIEGAELTADGRIVTVDRPGWFPA